MFLIKQNDTLPNLDAQLFDSDNNPLDLSMCSAVKFHMSDFENNIKINRKVSISDANNGKIKLEWIDGDTDTVGTFKCEFEVNMINGKTITVPNDGYFLVSIVPKLI